MIYLIALALTFTTASTSVARQRGSVDHGVMALKIDDVGLITRAGVMYDGGGLAPADRTMLAALSLES